MNRRSVLKGLLAVAAVAPGFRLPLVYAADHGGKLFVFVQADGGWDPMRWPRFVGQLDGRAKVYSG